MSTKILVVDDEQDIRELILEFLEESGRDFDVFEAADGEEAIRVVGEQRPDLVLLDIVMPGDMGWAVLKAVQANPQTRHTRVVVVSGLIMADVDHRSVSLPVGFSGSLSKPFTRAELLAEIDAALGVS